MKIVHLAKCDCGFNLGIQESMHEEARIGVLGTIKCPTCGAILNDKIEPLDLLKARQSKGEV